jgi:MFS family permease
MAGSAVTAVPDNAREPAGEAQRAHLGVTLLALAIAGMVVSLQQTLVVPLMPRLMREFDVTVTDVTWVFTASLLAGAVATPLLSRFGDMYGKKKMVLTAIASLVIGSIVCAVADTLPVLIAGRVLQGLSAAVVPLAIGMIRDVFPRERVTGAIGIISATMGVGGSGGMIVTGLIADHTDSHRPIFWLSGGLGAVGLVLVAVIARDVGRRVGGRPDLFGALLLAGWLVCLLLAISEGNNWGWTSNGVLGLFGGAAGLCVLWVVIELVVREPLVRLRLLVGPQSFTANLASILLGFSMFGAFTLISNLVQTPSKVGYGLDGSVLDVGLYMLPSTVTMLLFSALAGPIASRLGAAFTLAIGSVFAGLSYVWLAVSTDHVYDFLAFSAIQGVGFGVAYAALGTVAVQHVPMSQSSIASGINSLVRTTGGSIAGAATASVLTSQVIRGTSVPTLHGYVLCFIIVACVAGVAAVVAIIHGVLFRHARHRPGGESAPAATATPQGSPVADQAAYPASPVVAAAGVIRGQVRNGQGTPVSRAVVTLIDVGGRQLARAVTREDGRYAVDTPGSGSYVLIGSAGAHQPQAATVVVGDSPVDVDLVLGAASGLTGVITDAGSGEPLTGALVVATDARGEVVASSTTGADGGFGFAELVPGSYTLAVSAAGRRPEAVPVQVAGGDTPRLKVQLRSGVRVRGTVRASASGDPVCDARVTLLDAAGNVVGVSTTGSDGEYGFADLAEGEYTVIASGYAPVTQPLWISGESEDGFDFELGHQAAAQEASTRTP